MSIYALYQHDYCFGRFSSYFPIIHNIRPTSRDLEVMHIGQSVTPTPLVWLADHTPARHTISTCSSVRSGTKKETDTQVKVAKHQSVSHPRMEKR